MPLLPALRSQRQEDLKLEASLGYIMRPCLKIKIRQTKRYLALIDQSCKNIEQIDRKTRNKKENSRL
jgi:hypothetical protein